MKAFIAAFCFFTLMPISAHAGLLPTKGICKANVEYQNEVVEITATFDYGFLNSFRGVTVSYTFQGVHVLLDQDNGLTCNTTDRKVTMCSVNNPDWYIFKTVGAGFPFGAFLGLNDGTDRVTFLENCKEL